MIHTIGGQFGEFIIAIQSLKEVLIDKFSQILDINFNLEDFIYKLIVNFLKGLKDNEVITLKYLESQRYDFSNIPDEEEKRKEFKNFLIDEKRFYNKSIKILINHGLIDKSLYEVIINKFADIYFRNNIDINNPDVQLEINPQPENQDQIYLDSVKIKSEEILKENQLYEKLKKKIKFVFIKPEILKKKKNNYIGLITVDPVLDTYEKYTEKLIEEVEEIHQIENIISEDNEIKENNEINENMENIENMENNDNNKEIQAQEKDTKNITKEIKQECKLTILYLYIVPPKEPKFTSYEFINKAQLFRNVNLIGDCYISHRNVTDFYKITIIKNIHQEFRKMHKLYMEEITQNIPKDEEFKDNEDNELKTNSDKQETTKFEYSSKALLDIVKIKYNKCQEFINVEGEGADVINQYIKDLHPSIQDSDYSSKNKAQSSKLLQNNTSGSTINDCNYGIVKNNFYSINVYLK